MLAEHHSRMEEGGQIPGCYGFWQKKTLNWIMMGEVLKGVNYPFLLVDSQFF